VTWCAVDVTAPAGRRDEVASWLVAATGQAVEERPDGTLVGFLASRDRLAALRRQARGRFGDDVEMSGRALEPVDWTERWRDGLGPRQFGRLVVAPSWVSLTAAGAGEVRLTLDPEMAFGSGEHGSTRAALTLLERHLTPASTVLDLGSGSGILAIAAVLLGARLAIGVEMDGEAIPVAERNAERNGVIGRTRFVEGGAGELAPLLGPVDLVVSNILRTVNVALLPALLTALKPGGLAIFAGMEESEAELFRLALGRAGLAVADEAADEGWWAVAARRV
jgi:ribosomal protein L11 methyltransferase